MGRHSCHRGCCLKGRYCLAPCHAKASVVEEKGVTEVHHRSSFVDRCSSWMLLGGAVITVCGLLLAFIVAPLVPGVQISGFELIGEEVVTNKLLLSQKIFYFHMPVAIVSMVALVSAGYYSVRYVKSRNMRFDWRATIAVEVSLVFILCTMATGIVWQRFEWNVWWTWDPRLTTYFVLMVVVFGYFILRNAVDDPERRALYSAVVCIIACVDVPLCFAVTRLIPSSIHPVVLRADAGLSADMALPLMACLIGFMMVAFGLYRLRLRQSILEQQVDAVKKTLDERK